MENESKESNVLSRIKQVPVQITVELGRRRMRISDLLQLGPGSTIELTTTAGEPLDIRVNDRLVARGEAVAIGDSYGVRVVEVVSDDEKNAAVEQGQSS